MRINRRVACGIMAAGMCSLSQQAFAAPNTADRFAGFPPVGQFRKPKRTLPVITSDGVKGVLWPKWTRAMTDIGGWPSLFRFNKAIYFVFYHGDGR